LNVSSFGMMNPSAMSRTIEKAEPPAKTLTGISYQLTVYRLPSTVYRAP
jgi:hypothetical protein